MPISIAGSGTITGISAGGLPDDCITTAEIAANAVTTAKLGTAEVSGLCKAWVNFNGTGTVAIRASYNVSSITDNGTGDYTVNFTTALADANFSTICGGQENFTAGTDGFVSLKGNTTQSSLSSIRIACSSSGISTTSVGDFATVNVAIFR